MLRTIAITAAFSCALASAAAAQRAKVDSLLVPVPRPRAAAADMVLTAFVQQGLEVTDNSASLITSNQGTKMNSFTKVRYTRVVRALLLSSDSTTTQVLLTGTETREAAIGGTRTQRIMDRKFLRTGRKLRVMVGASITQ